jgi:HAD superfamily hydrolase (TIGR01490 family)
VSLAIFDLDNTLLGGDSDYLWGQFLVEHGVVDGDFFEQENQRFYAAYQAGTLDIQKYLEFALQPLAANDPSVMHQWRQRFIAERIRPLILPKAKQLLQRHRNAGDILLIITATSRFVTQPIAELLNVPHLLATEVEVKDGRYTGKSFDIPCFQAGKVKRLETWLEAMNCTLKGSWFYSDSCNDLPLLNRVDHPVAVDPDPALAHCARDKGWPIISLREI